MSIPLTSVVTIEVISHGVLAAGGSDSQVCLNNFHFRRTSTVVNPNKANISQAFATQVLTPLKALVSADWSVPFVGVRYIDDATDPEVLTAPAGGVVGAVATDRTPDHMSVTFLLRTALRGRSYRGSKHFAAICEANTTKDLIAAADVAAWQALGAAMLAGFTDSDGNVWKLVVLSRKLSILNTNPTTVTTADVSQVLLNKNLGSMNSRKVATVR